MRRKPRIEDAAAICQVMSRTKGKGDVFRHDVDRQVSWGDLAGRAKSAPGKLALAARVCRETTLTLRWTAERLHLGSWKSCAAKLHRWRKTHKEGPQ